MADGRGGYRKPQRPAPASGPGRLARRTDGGPAQKMRDLPNAEYGEATEFENLQRAAPLSLAGGAEGGGGGGGIPPTPLGAPSERPSEPTTEGALFGAGSGPETLGIDLESLRRQDIEFLRPYIPALEIMASNPSAPPSAVNFVRRLRAMLV